MQLKLQHRSLGFSLGHLYPHLLLLAISLPLLTWRLDVYPSIWFDEGYRLNAARTLLEKGVYATYTTEGYMPFDPGASSGPTELVAVVLSFKFFGIGVVQARWAIIPFALAALFSLYAISAYLYGKTAGLFASLVLLATPAIQDTSFLLLGRQVMSEAPALALVTLGLWLWFRSWDNRSWSWGILAGAVMGIGLLSKTQVAFAFWPAMLLITVTRYLKTRSNFVESLLPFVVMGTVVSGWKFLEYVATPEYARQENVAQLVDAVQTLLLTGLFGRTLSSPSVIMFAVMMVGALAYGWRMSRLPLKARFSANTHWAEATIALFVLVSALWFAFVSIGWPRYAYAGWTVSLLLVGKLAWDIFQWLGHVFERYQRVFAAYGHMLAMVGLVLTTLLTNGRPIWQFKGANWAQEVGTYISKEIPHDAVIESWEWELDALSSHWEFHHPNQRYLFLAIRQRFHDQRQFQLEYDLLQADPDYLITGPFSDWTHIYGGGKDIQAHFEVQAIIGPYHIYQRIRQNGNEG